MKAQNELAKTRSEINKRIESIQNNNSIKPPLVNIELPENLQSNSNKINQTIIPINPIHEDDGGNKPFTQQNDYAINNKFEYINDNRQQDLSKSSNIIVKNDIDIIPAKLNHSQQDNNNIDNMHAEFTMGFNNSNYPTHTQLNGSPASNEFKKGDSKDLSKVQVNQNQIYDDFDFNNAENKQRDNFNNTNWDDF